MIVTLDDAVFSSPQTETLALFRIFHLGFVGRHRIQTRPLFEPGADRAVNRWLEQRDAVTRDEVLLALEEGAKEAILGVPSDRAVTIVDAVAPDWSADPPRLPVQIAAAWLDRPLQLLVENRRNDGAFLRCVAPEPWRSRLIRGLEERRLELTHGGGLTEMSFKVQEAGANPEERLRLWVLFDSDSREPGQPSQASEAVRSRCEAAGIPHHQLRRRERENYLPRQALAAGAELASARRKAEQRRCCRAFSALQPEQRHHYNMRYGVEGDRRDHQRGVSALFADVETHRDLQRGFGEKIGDLFLQQEFPILEEWLRRDGQAEESMAMIQAVFRLL